MPKTDFLELEITTDDETKFEQWRNAINGPDNSNAKKIDAFAENIHERVDDKLNKIWADITEQTTTNLTDILVFNRGSNVYKTTIANLLSQVDTQLYLVVAELPATGNPNKIYLVPSSDPKTQNVLDEFIWVDNAWEKIGALSVDLSNYFTKTEIISLFDGKQDKLVAGDNITIEDNVISADGGLNVETWNTATRTLVLSDANKLFKCSHATNQTLTIPTNATVAFPIGTMFTFLLSSTNKVTFSGASGVTLTSIDSLVELATQYGMASLIKTDTNTWQLVGALE